MSMGADDGPRGYITERDIIAGIRAIRASWQVRACDGRESAVAGIDTAHAARVEER